jgi:hypothetical protein
MRETGSSRRTRPSLQESIERAGYFPQVVGDAVADAVGGEPVLAHLVHQETTFDTDEVRRHVTVVALTETRLVVAHTDDHPAGSETPSPLATTSTEIVPLDAVRSVVVNRVVADPATYVPGADPHEVVLTVGWGAVGRVDLEPAGCSDPSCEADHGYTGTMGADDLSLRVSAAAEGPDVVAEALDLARALSRALSRPAGRR